MSDLSFEEIAVQNLNKCMLCRYFDGKDCTCHLNPPVAISTKRETRFVYPTIKDPTSQWCGKLRLSASLTREAVA